MAVADQADCDGERTTADGAYVIVDVKHKWHLALQTGADRSTIVFENVYNFKEHSVTTLVVRRAPSSAQTFAADAVEVETVTDVKGNDVWIPLVVAVAICFGLAIVVRLLNACYAWATQDDADEGDDDLRENRDFIVDGHVRCVTQWCG